MSRHHGGLIPVVRRERRELYPSGRKVIERTWCFTWLRCWVEITLSGPER